MVAGLTKAAASFGASAPSTSWPRTLSQLLIFARPSTACDAEKIRLRSTPAPFRRRCRGLGVEHDMSELNGATGNRRLLMRVPLSRCDSTSTMLGNRRWSTSLTRIEL